ncbi:MAG TPA: MBL fold metallo-hydrolase [Actinomycetota bacterium]|nr:MBL fold metallo-hydrolase [Actinomycetota bacterium]
MNSDLSRSLSDALTRARVPAVPILIPTPWDVGEVTAYLFAGDPVTLIDSGIDTREGRSALSEALRTQRLTPSDVDQVLVTHAHTDHFGGAIWLQQESGCDVFVHRSDLGMATNPNWRETERGIFPTLGFTDEEVEAFFAGHSHEWRFPEFTAFADGQAFDVGATRLSIEHHPGHTPGHVWIVDEPSGALFVGDYLLSNHPTNAGLESDDTQPHGRAPLLQQYNAGLRELLERDAPALFPAHGPAIEGHRELTRRRLQKTDRRTRHVLEGLQARKGPATPVALGRALYRDRMDRNWEVVADLVGRLDLLVAEGRATARMGEDGAWYFEAV